MFLIRILYVSRTHEDFGPEDINSILEQARINNKRNKVTGLLYFNNKYFLQCLEGGRGAVNDIYQKILKDKRHSDVIILDYSEIEKREFEEWSMGYIPTTSITSSINLKYSSNDEFTPYEMSGKSVLSMMVEVKSSI